MLLFVTCSLNVNLIEDTNFCETKIKYIKIQKLSSETIHLEKSSVKWRWFCSVKWNQWVGIAFAVFATPEQPTHSIGTPLPVK